MKCIQSLLFAKVVKLWYFFLNILKYFCSFLLRSSHVLIDLKWFRKRWKTVSKGSNNRRKNDRKDYGDCNDNLFKKSKNIGRTQVKKRRKLKENMEMMMNVMYRMEQEITLIYSRNKRSFVYYWSRILTNCGNSITKLLILIIYLMLIKKCVENDYNFLSGYPKTLRWLSKTDFALSEFMRTMDTWVTKYLNFN